MYRGPGGRNPLPPIPDQKYPQKLFGPSYRPNSRRWERPDTVPTSQTLWAGFGGGLGSMDPYTSAIMGIRGAGGSGGGSEASEGNMDANELIALSEFLGQNVTSFAGGGKMKNPYKYDDGGNWGGIERGKMRLFVESDPVLRRLLPGKRLLFEHSDDPNEGVKFRFSDYVNPSTLRDSLNQSVAANQIKNIIVGNPLVASMPTASNPLNTIVAANKGMKMKKRYTQGGRF